MYKYFRWVQKLPQVIIFVQAFDQTPKWLAVKRLRLDIYTLFYCITKFIQHRAWRLFLSPQSFEEICKRMVLIVSCYMH